MKKKSIPLKVCDFQTRHRTWEAKWYSLRFSFFHSYHANLFFLIWFLLLSSFLAFLFPTQLHCDFLAFLAVRGLLAVFNRYDVKIIPHVDVFLFYLWERVSFISYFLPSCSFSQESILASIPNVLQMNCVFCNSSQKCIYFHSHFVRLVICVV